MKKKGWTTGDIQKLFRLEGNSRFSLFNAESKQLIPKATRIPRGTTQVRVWELEQLSEIGKHFGFLKHPNKKLIICVYTPKGGVLKTSYGYNLARTIAINGIRVLIIGMDIAQASITGYALPPLDIQSLDELNEIDLGLYHHFFENASLDEIIKHTSLPTLDIIPETPELNLLEMKLRFVKRREYFIKDKLLNELQERYEVILFDNGPGWNQLVENSLTASNIVVSPIGCEIEAYKALDRNISAIMDFQKEMNIKWDNVIHIPTLLETNKLSQQIYGKYLNKYADTIIPVPIRRSVKGQEARAFHASVIEYDPSSALADDYYRSITQTWARLQ